MEKFETISEQLEYIEKIISTGNYDIGRKGQYWYILQNENLKYEVLYIPCKKKLTFKNLLNNDIQSIKFKFNHYSNDDFLIKEFFRSLFFKIRNTISDEQKDSVLNIKKLYEELLNITSNSSYECKFCELYKQIKIWIESYSSSNTNILAELQETKRREIDKLGDYDKSNSRIKLNIGFILDLAEDLNFY